MEPAGARRLMSPPMRILQGVRDMHPRQGGPPRVVAGAAAALARQGHAVTIFATTQAGASEIPT